MKLRATPVVAGISKEVHHPDAVVDPIGDLKRASQNALAADDLVVIVLLVTREVHIASIRLSTSEKPPD